MYVVRFLHAFYSLLVVYFGFKIAEKISGISIAKKAGLILALLWILPFMSVRNLIEMACIPPMMAGFWFLIKNENVRRNFFFAGLFFGLTFAFRYQTMLIAGTAFMVLFFKKEFRNSLILLCGFVISVLLVQGTADVLAWGKPFASFWSYLTYNSMHGEDYTSGAFYNYLLLILGILLPPTSLLLLWGFVRTWKKQILIFLPVLMFFLFHSYFPNKQERFILPIVPMFMVLAVIGWEQLVGSSEFWKRRKSLLKGFWVWFWVLNTLLLAIFTFTYSKKTRCESLYYLSDKKDLTGLFLSGGKLGTIQPPLFYLNKYGTPVYLLKSTDTLENISRKFADGKSKLPNYIIFFGKENIDKRTEEFKKSFSKRLVPETEIQPSLVDDIFYYLNPKFNVNQTAFIYRIE